MPTLIAVILFVAIGGWIGLMVVRSVRKAGITTPRPMKHSRLGIASLVVSLVQIAAIAAALVVIAVSVEGDAADDSWQSTALALAGATALFATLLAMALGIAGLVQKDRDKTFAILGTVLSIGTVLIVVSLAIYGSESAG